MLGRDSEDEIWCVWTCDMNSTLGSVVPLAMFRLFSTFRFHSSRRNPRKPTLSIGHCSNYPLPRPLKQFGQLLHFWKKCQNQFWGPPKRKGVFFSGIPSLIVLITRIIITMIANYIIILIAFINNLNLTLTEPGQVVLITTIIITMLINVMITIAIMIISITNLNLTKPRQVAEIKLFQSLKGAQGMRWHLLQLKSEKALRFAKYSQTGYNEKIPGKSCCAIITIKKEGGWRHLNLIITNIDHHQHPLHAWFAFFAQCNDVFRNPTLQAITRHVEEGHPHHDLFTWWGSTLTGWGRWGRPSWRRPGLQVEPGHLLWLFVISARLSCGRTKSFSSVLRPSLILSWEELLTRGLLARL